MLFTQRNFSERLKKKRKILMQIRKEKDKGTQTEGLYLGFLILGNEEGEQGNQGERGNK